MSGPTAGLCETHRAAVWEILDTRVRADIGMRIQQVGTGKNNVPSWSRTQESRMKQIKAIQRECVGHD